MKFFKKKKHPPIEDEVGRIKEKLNQAFGVSSEEMRLNAKLRMQEMELLQRAEERIKANKDAIPKMSDREILEAIYSNMLDKDIRNLYIK